MISVNRFEVFCWEKFICCLPVTKIRDLASVIRWNSASQRRFLRKTSNHPSRTGFSKSEMRLEISTELLHVLEFILYYSLGPSSNTSIVSQVQNWFKEFTFYCRIFWVEEMEEFLKKRRKKLLVIDLKKKKFYKELTEYFDSVKAKG